MKRVAAKPPKQPTKGLLYLAMGPIPVYVGVTADEKAYWKEIKRLGIPDPMPFITKGSSACTHIFETTKGGVTYVTCLITVSPDTVANERQLGPLLAHEAVHVAKSIWEHMRETKPGEEMEAYTVQYIMLRALDFLVGGNP